MVEIVRKYWFAGLLAAAVSLTLLAGTTRGPRHTTGETTRDNGQVIAVPLQLERDRYGLAMVDTGLETLWIYEISHRGPAYQTLRLLAARSWKYDRHLEQFNNSEPTVEQVKRLLENLKHEGRPDEENTNNTPETPPAQKTKTEPGRRDNSPGNRTVQEK
jgi:hypothetical protein